MASTVIERGEEMGKGCVQTATARNERAFFFFLNLFVILCYTGDLNKSYEIRI